MEEYSRTKTNETAKLYKLYFAVGIVVDAGLNITETVRMKIIGKGYEMLDILTIILTFITILIFSAIILNVKKENNNNTIQGFLLVTLGILFCSYLLSHFANYIVELIIKNKVPVT